MSRLSDLPVLNFARPTLIARKGDKHDEILCLVRKKWVALEPEEWVRQNFLRFLKSEKNYPASLMSLERQVSVNKMIKRFDAVIYKNGNDSGSK